MKGAKSGENMCSANTQMISVHFENQSTKSKLKSKLKQENKKKAKQKKAKNKIFIGKKSCFFLSSKMNTNIVSKYYRHANRYLMKNSQKKDNSIKFNISSGRLVMKLTKCNITELTCF